MGVMGAVAGGKGRRRRRDELESSTRSSSKVSLLGFIHRLFSENLPLISISPYLSLFQETRSHGSISPENGENPRHRPSIDPQPNARFHVLRNGHSISLPFFSLRNDDFSLPSSTYPSSDSHPRLPPLRRRVRETRSGKQQSGFEGGL